MKKKVLVAGVFSAGVVIAGLSAAAPASAAPGGMNFSCAPCVGDINGDGTTQPIWNEIFASSGNGKGPWETAFSADPWGKAFDATDGVPGDGQGAWEKVFPP